MIACNNKYRVDVSLIDEEYSKLIDVINKAIDAKQHKKNPEEIKEMLNNIIRYAIKYFATEEIYMIDSNYPEYQYHKEEHLDFSKKVIAYYNRIIICDYQVANKILEYLKRWLFNHFQETDKRFTGYFNKNGLK